MVSYLIRRVLLMMLTLFGVSVLIFLLLRLVPGNIADILFDAAGMIDPVEKQKIVVELGLDQPLVVQYTQWIGGLLRGDLGFSYISEKPTIDEIAPRLPITATLAVMALVLSVITGVPLGVISAVRQNTKLDYALRVFSLSGLSLPSFWLGLLILMAFVNWFGTIPIYDRNNSPMQQLAFMLVPAAAVGFRASALIMRLTRSSMLEVLRQDYIRTARAKGLPHRRIVFRHALANALIPITTVIGIIVSLLISGSVVTESLFSIPGIGQLLTQAVLSRDYPMVQGGLLITTALLVLVNIVVDVCYAALDPRVRYDEQ